MINFYCFWKKQCLFFQKSSSYYSSSTISNWGEGKFNGPSNGVNRLEIYDWIFFPSPPFCSVLFCSALFYYTKCEEMDFRFFAEIENKTFISQMKLFNLISDVMNEKCWFCSAPLWAFLFWKFAVLMGILLQIFRLL